MNALKFSFRCRRMTCKILGKRFYAQRHGYAASLTEHEEEDTELMAKYKPLEKLPVKPPFMKNVFQGRFDTDLLAFPEFLGAERLKLLEKNAQTVQKLMDEHVNSYDIDINGQIPDNVLEKLRQLKLFGLGALRAVGGAEFTHTERARIYEIVSRDASIGAMLFNQEILGHQLIAKYGDDSIKDQYLKSLVSGKKLSTMCFGEADHGSNAAHFQTYAQRVGTNWLVTGSKVWAMNADKADVFIVFAKVRLSDDAVKKNIYYTKDNEEILEPENIGIFLVDKNAENVTVDPKPEAIGLRGLSMCRVTFKNAPVPEKNILADFPKGYDIVKEMMCQDRYLVGSLALGMLKNIQSDVTKFSITKKLNGENLYKFGLVQQKLSKLTVALYAMESLIYFTTGLIDMYSGQDCEVENAIVKVFCSEVAWKELNSAMQILGGQSLFKDSCYDRYFRDMRMLSFFDNHNDLYRCLITLNSLQYISNDLNEVIYEERNPLFYAYRNVTKIFRYRLYRQEVEDPVLHLKLNEFLHPSLMFVANILETCVLRFQHGVHNTLSRLGPNTVDDQLYIKRLADCAIIIYAMTAVLSRASRSYCIGSKNSTEEMLIAETFVRDQNEKFKLIVEGLINGEYYVTDGNHKRVADLTVNNFGYFPTEPLKLNY